MHKRNLLIEEDYDYLPFRENRASYFTNTPGLYYGMWHHGQYKMKESPWKWSKWLLKKYLGKPFSEAFSHFCRIIDLLSI